jgi:hypothetical protein
MRPVRAVEPIGTADPGIESQAACPRQVRGRSRALVGNRARIAEKLTDRAARADGIGVDVARAAA